MGDPASIPEIFTITSPADFRSALETGSIDETSLALFGEALRADEVEDKNLFSAIAAHDLRAISSLLRDPARTNYLLRALWRLGHVPLFAPKEEVLRQVGRALKRDPSPPVQASLSAPQSIAAPPQVGPQCDPVEGYLFAGALRQERAVQAPTVVVVDGYSSGNLLAPALRAQGYGVVHVHSEPNYPLPPYKPTFREEDYDRDLHFGGKFRELLDLVEGFSPLAVIAGTESGVSLADKLSAALGTPNNGLSLSQARRDKFEMGEAIQKAGLRSPKQFRSDSLEEILGWVSSHGRWPVVLKPLMSAGTEDVYICHNRKEVEMAFGNIYGKQNKMGILNDFVLVQEYIPGKEFAVNTVSSKGRHVVTDIWLYEKHEIKGGATVYDVDWLLPFEGEEQAQLVPYAFRVLDALGLRHGSAHLEIKLPPDGGPVLIEMGARLYGGGFPALAGQATGQSQVELSLMTYLNPERFPPASEGYRLRKHAAVLQLQSQGKGGRLSFRMLGGLRKLPGVSRVTFSFGEGDLLPRSKDLSTYVGAVELLHPDPEVLKKTIQTIREWEKQGLFEQ